MACEHGVPFGFGCDKCPPPSEDGMVEIDIRGLPPIERKASGGEITCPCCGSTDTTGAKTARLSTICWKCYALFKEAPGGAVQVDECTCGHHDNGKVVKRKTEEVAENVRT